MSDSLVKKMLSFPLKPAPLLVDLTGSPETQIDPSQESLSVDLASDDEEILNSSEGGSDIITPMSAPGCLEKLASDMLQMPEPPTKHDLVSLFRKMPRSLLRRTGGEAGDNAVVFVVGQVG